MSLSVNTEKLGDLISLAGGGTPSKDKEEYWGNEIPWATVKDLKSNSLIKTQDYITKLGLNNSASKIVQSGSIIIATRMAVGRVVLTELDVAINQDLKGITCSDKIHTKYLYYFLFSQENYFNRVSSGATVKGIKITHIMDIKIPLPPLPEQQKIAAILDAADKLRQKNQQLIEQYTALSQSLFLDMFGDPVTNPMGWDIKPFDFFAIIDTKMTTDFIKYADVPHIGIANIEKETGKLNNYNLVRDEKLTSGKYIFTPNHIIYSKIRPNLNKVALPDFNGLCSADSYPILATANKANRLFFAYILRSSYFVDFILKHSSRTNIPKANKSQMKLFRGMAPPITLQNQFAERIQAIEAQKQQAQASLKKSDDLFNSLLQRAFKAELTT